jgi:DNA/RNA-binding domain of Phe-tRNA-synthetase-like protein
MELELGAGWVEPELAAELPGLGLSYAEVAARPGRSPAAVRERLRALADRLTGPRVVHMRNDAVPWAYRVFARQVGVDPDVDRTPVERLAVERLRHGGLASAGLVAEAVTIAILETGVPVLALDAERVEGAPGLRAARAGEALGELMPLAPGRLVVADAVRPLAELLGEPGPWAAVGRHTRRVLLCGLRVKGVPPMAVEEALWTAAETIYT